jgi:hypothetical protein
MYQDSLYYSELSAENKLIVLCSRTNSNSEIKAKLDELIQKDLDWDYVINFVYKHRLAPLIYWNLKEFQFQIPNVVFNSLKENFNENAKNNLLMLGELLKLLNLFEEQGLNVIPYKGPLLAIHAYKNLSFRHFDDLDIFVDKIDVLKVKKILILNGYNPQFELQGIKERRFINSQREYKFMNPETKISIELHWQFQGVSFSLPDDPLFGVDSKNTMISNKEVKSLSNENMLMVLSIHASQHLWERLSWICDISELIQSHEMNWEYVLKKADKLGIKRLLMVNLLLAHDLLDLNLPNNIIKQLKSEIVQNLAFKVKKRIYLPCSDNIFQTADLRLNIREKRTHRIKDLIKIMFLPTNKEWNESSTKSHFPPISYFFRFIHFFRNY